MKVFLRVPTNGDIDRELTRWLLWLVSKCEYVQPDIHYSNFGPAEARNEITEEFLSSDGFTHLWMVDRDVVPPRNLCLLSHDKPIVCGVYKGYKGGGKAHLQVYRPHPKKVGVMVPLTWVDLRKVPHNPFLVAAAGTGCMMIRRDVLEGSVDPFYYVKTLSGQKVGEDITFCNAHQGQVWLDRGYVCSHYQDVNLNNLEGA